MRRLLAVLLAILIPLQSAMGTIVPITGMDNRECVPAFEPAAHQVEPDEVRACDCANLSHTGAHGVVHNHACPHVSMATVAVAPASSLSFPAGYTAPIATAAAFESIVLDVPSPPPTRNA